MNKCLHVHEDTKESVQKLDHDISKLNRKKACFDTVYTTLREIENSEPAVIESLFYYKVNDREETDKEA